MADQCGRCACVMEDWEHDLCLICGVIVGLSGEADRLRRLAAAVADAETADLQPVIERLRRLASTDPDGEATPESPSDRPSPAGGRHG